jgi:hypothetical protein
MEGDGLITAKFGEENEFTARVNLWGSRLGCPAEQNEASVTKPATDKNLGWETGIEPATVGATVRCSAS